MAKKAKSGDGQLRLKLEESRCFIRSVGPAPVRNNQVEQSGAGKLVSIEQVRKGNARDFLVNELRKSGIYEAMKKK